MRESAVNDVSAKTVLVVEDDPLVLLSAVAMIEDAGYDVLEAANADEAIALLEAHPQIRVVFTDIEMPGSMDGLKLAAYVRDRWPPVAIIVTSGRILPGEGLLPTDGVFLAKPYRSEDLASHLSAFLPAA